MAASLRPGCGKGAKRMAPGKGSAARDRESREKSTEGAKEKTLCSDHLSLLPGLMGLGRHTAARFACPELLFRPPRGDFLSPPVTRLATHRAHLRFRGERCPSLRVGNIRIHFGARLAGAGNGESNRTEFRIFTYRQMLTYSTSAGLTWSRLSG